MGPPPPPKTFTNAGAAQWLPFSFRPSRRRSSLPRSIGVGSAWDFPPIWEDCASKLPLLPTRTAYASMPRNSGRGASMAEGTEFSESTGAPGVDPVVLGYERRLWVCAVIRRRLSSGCNPHPATALAGSNRSRHGGDEMSEAFD
jgi:hypothetical protein